MRLLKQYAWYFMLCGLVIMLLIVGRLMMNVTLENTPTYYQAEIGKLK